MKKLLILLVMVLSLVVAYSINSYVKAREVIGGVEQTATSSSANLRTALSDETGTGLAVFATAPTFTTSIAFNAVTDTVASIQNQNLVDKSAAEALAGNWEVQDNVHFSLGNDDDFSWVFNTASGNLELVNSSDAVLFWIEATGNANSASVAAPAIGLYDSSAAGTDRADEYAGGIDANMTTTTEDSEVSDVNIYYMDTSQKAGITMDGSENHVYVPTGAKFSAGIQSYNADTISDTSTPHLLTAAEVSGCIISNYDSSAEAKEFDLPAAAEGYNFIIALGLAQNVTIDPNASEVIYLNGTALTGGYSVTNAAPTIGETISFYTIQTGASTWGWIAKSSDTDFADLGS